MARRRLVVFDCDGTLTDSHHIIVAAMTETFQSSGLQAPDDLAIRHVIGLSLPSAIQTLNPDLEETAVAQLTKTYKSVFMTQRIQGQHDEQLYPGVRACLEGLREAGCTLAIATGKSKRGLDHVIARHKLGGFFSSLQTADFHPSKPHPAMLQAAMDEAEAAPQETVMVGDSPYDIVMGRSAGTSTVGVAWTDHGPNALLSVGADAVLQSYEDWAVLLSAGETD